MGFVLGGDTAWKVRRHGDMAVAFHWIKGECAMVIYPLHRLLRTNNAVPYALLMSSAHELVKEGSGGNAVDTDALLKKAKTAAMVMGLGDDYHVIHGLADIILNSIDELCDMPPEPLSIEQMRLRKRGPAIGSIAIREDGKTIHETEIH